MDTVYLQHGAKVLVEVVTDDKDKEIEALKHQIKCLNKSEYESSQRAFKAAKRADTAEAMYAEANARSDHMRDARNKAQHEAASANTDKSFLRDTIDELRCEIAQGCDREDKLHQRLHKLTTAIADAKRDLDYDAS